MEVDDGGVAETRRRASILARRMACYLEKTGYIDTTVQKAGIPGFSGYLEHATMIWHQIQAAKKEGRDLHVVFLDLANAFGSVPHNLLWTAFTYFGIPEANLVQAYFQDIQLCLSTEDFTTAWQPMEVGIMAGCTIPPVSIHHGHGGHHPCLMMGGQRGAYETWS